MKITNKEGLPQPFVQFAENSFDYKVAQNEYRVTSLLKGIRETILERRHDHEIEVDVADLIWLIFGQAVHHILEKYSEGESQLKEERIKVTFGDRVLSGQFDLYDEAGAPIISDYKTASIWKIVYQNYEDWRKQLLIYSFMMKECGFPVHRAQSVPLLKDHSKRKAKREKGYPQLPVKKILFKFTDKDFADIEEWLWGRFKEIEIAEKLSDDELPLCSEEERFNKGDKYAVMKENRKTALRVLDSKEEAERWSEKNGKGDYIEVRKGEDVKCIDYCFVNKFCNYYLENVKEDTSAKE